MLEWGRSLLDRVRAGIRATKGSASHKLRSFRQESGNIAMMTALLLAPIIGALCMGVEASSWFVMRRAAQNAADSAAVAAANNAAVYNGTKAQWQAEGKATARRYGFTDGANNATVTIDTADVTSEQCPDGATTKCFKATVTKKVPIYLAAVVGYRGNTTIGTRRAVLVTSYAYAEPVSGIKYPTCLTVTGTGSSGSGIDTKGAPFSNMKGCSISAIGPTTNVTCNAGGIGGQPSIFATGTVDTACTTGNILSNGPSTAYVDPYKDYYKKIPCGINSGDATANCDSAATAPTCAPFTGTLTLGSCYTGNINYPDPGGGTKFQTVSLTGPSTGGVVYVKNGSVNLNYLKLVTTDVTFVFTGTTPGGFTDGSKDGSLDLNAPGSGTWSGVAAYQDTHLASSTWLAPSLANNGNTPKLDLIGLLYLPRTDADFGGGAGQTTKATTCYIAVLHSFQVNGTALSMTRSGCTAEGLGVLPTVTILRAALVK